MLVRAVALVVSYSKNYKNKGSNTPKNNKNN